MTPVALNFIRAEAWPDHSFELPPLQNHRGHWVSGFQENTIAAFRASKVAGYKMCELDVRISKDHVPVVFHDEDLRRLAGRARNVNELTAQELKEAVFAPSLREVLLDASVPEFFNIELKCPITQVGRMEPLVAQVIRDVRAEDRVLFSSFNPLSLAACSYHLPEVPRALLVTEQKAKDNLLALRRLWLAPFLKIHLLHLDDGMLTPEWLDHLQDKKIPFAAWTVNDAVRGNELLARGARSLITDKILP